MTNSIKITVQATIDADLTTVWNSYTNPEHITKWNFASEDWQCPYATNDLRVGGKYSARMEARDGSFGFDFEAIYDEIVEKEKIVYTMTDGRQATVHFKGSDFRTEVSIVFDAETENSVELQKGGWQAILNNFKNYCESKPSKMKKLEFKIELNSSAEKAFNTMLGLKDISTYEKWTSEFNPTSTYEGSWVEGSKILFIGIGEGGKRGGMVSRISKNVPDQFISIEHYGILDGEIEITSGPQVERWAGGFENYSFREEGGNTIITVEIDVVDEFIDYFQNTYPKALDKLKEVIEHS